MPSAPASGTRIVGIDVARGLAVLGMFAAHVGFTPAFDWVEPASWLDIVNGRSSILFALLAGVSIALLSGRETPVDGVELVRARVRILVRAALIFTIGGLLEVLGTSIAVILPTYAALFVLSLPFLRWRLRSLFIASGVIAVVVPILFALVLPFADEPPTFAGTGTIVVLLVTGNYPGLLWLAFVLAGLALGRLDLASLAVQLRLLVAGVVLTAAAYSLGALGGGGEPAGRLPGVVDLAALVTVYPHSGSPFEVVGSGGFAVAVVALALLATRARVGRTLLFPVASVGRMALTAYSAHIVVIAVLGLSATMSDNPDNGQLFDFAVIALVLCSLWTRFLGAGPLERLLTVVSHRAAALTRADKLEA